MSETTSPLLVALGEIDLGPAAVSPDILRSVLDLAIEIAREGREGRRVGTIFTVGAEEAVLEHSSCLILDPLAGHPVEARSITDADLRETVKELAQLDGGFVVGRDGTVLSACRYFEVVRPRRAQPLGLGTRHLAAASISAATGAVAVVVSESSVVRIYAAGELLTEVLPELWLLHRYMPHIARATMTGDEEQNLAVVTG
jgi:diadenylate cyclase